MSSGTESGVVGEMGERLVAERGEEQEAVVLGKVSEAESLLAAFCMVDSLFRVLPAREFR